MDVAPSNALRLMSTQGGEFWKFHYRQRARPTRVHVQLLINPGDPSKDAIVWKDIGDKDWYASMAVSEMMNITQGPVSKTFTDNKDYIINPDMCFSLQSRGRTLDLEAVHPEDHRVWSQGLAFLIDPERRGWEEKSSGGRGRGGLLSELELHLERGYAPGEGIEGIAEWVALKRQSGLKKTPLIDQAPPPVDVDQMFAAGAYRQEILSSPANSPPASMPVPQRTPPHQRGPHQDYSAGYSEGLRVASLMRQNSP
eukprot:TRINITY_DN10041_c0_g1_i1.p1 TRINITY_DN10041_c0_g1~~TRINITY_DN10041_c0_g1_i1.p1  ORF type:complete len:278 (+),score=62.51 TRINITY_DN10041_c0_g1_i1:74-835(+)